MFVREKKRIGDMLLTETVITEKQLADALVKQKGTKQKIGTLLIEMGYATEHQIAHTLQKQMGLDMVELSSHKIPIEILNMITDISVLTKHVIMPFEFDSFDSKYLRVAMADPLDIIAMDDISVVTGMQITPVIATPGEILACIDKYYGSAANQAVAEKFSQEQSEAEDLDEELTNDAVENAPIVVLIKKIIEQAVRQRASDIHIESLETKIRVRYRIDGVLQNVGSYQINLLSAIITRIKIIGGMDISEKRKPQDGRITHQVDRQEYDIRVSILPTVFGEKVVMRLTSKQNLTRDKRQLGFSEEELNKFNQIFANPNGIILVTGPTGSGKSTTLYTALSELNKEDVNIITVEDPVEANLDGINQVQVNPKADLTFASSLRSILRQDPDIIMIGEIRDEETARIAVTASITGHLVVSTLHTNSAASSITRLADMGVEPYLIADSVVGVIAQRLVRRLCSCKTMRKLTDREKRMFGLDLHKDYDIYEPHGCAACNETGYRGRIGIYEIMPISSKIRNVISIKGSADEIQKIAIEDGMLTMREAILSQVISGITSIEEMKRIVYSENEDEKV
jgi:type IV pilus assembly protein PilB